MKVTREFRTQILMTQISRSDEYTFEGRKIVKLKYVSMLTKENPT